MTKLFHKTVPNFRVVVCRLTQRIALSRDCGLPIIPSNRYVFPTTPSRNLQTKVITQQSSTTQTVPYNYQMGDNAYSKGVHLMQFRNKSEDVKGKAIVEKKESPYSGLTTAEKVKEAGKDVTYTGIVIVGIAVTGFMFYYIGKELLSSQSPSGVHTKAYKLCQHNTEVEAAFGTPLKTYGETTRRGRRRHVSHVEFEENGVKNMRMKFYLEGPYKKGTVHLQAKKNESGKYEFVYLFVEVDTFPPRTIFIEDKR